MFGIPGGWEIVIIIAVVILLFGGDKARASIKSMGKNLYKAKKEIDEIKDLTKK